MRPAVHGCSISTIWMPISTSTNTPCEIKRRTAMKRPSGTGYYFKKPHSRFWWIGYHRNGKFYRESTGTTDERAARRFLQHRIAEAASENFITPQTARVKVEELPEDLLRDYK